MTPNELQTFCRQAYNAVGDTFYSDEELYGYMYWAQMQLAKEARCIRNIYTTTTTADTQEYAKPTNCWSIRRITYDGIKLSKVTMKEDDTLTITNSSTAATGTPAYYFEWARSIFLRPIPSSSSGTLKIWSYDVPQTVSSDSSLDVPAEYHHDLTWWVLKMMAIKDKNPEMAASYDAHWKDAKREVIRSERIKIRGDAFYGVNDEDTMQQTVIGQL